MIDVDIYRYNPETDREPHMQSFFVDDDFGKRMVLDVLEHLRESDPSLAYRRSCREGVCGSDGMNINGKNALACITPVTEAAGSGKLILRPLTGMAVIRDLVVDQNHFFEQYASIKPWLINDSGTVDKELHQSAADRAKLDGLYECIMCGCCTSGCPSWWWNPEKYLGPAVLLQAYRFIADSRDTASGERLGALSDHFSVYRCRDVGNCSWVCPKGLNPMGAISDIRRTLLKTSL
ncbi:MAG: succinate dehydrogenase [Gammaproteobacteria bacterium BRH_c0]|nr:MAG: succinate dehydrogenase [Gammaproteobacteria bacterium BRH_c0]